MKKKNKVAGDLTDLIVGLGIGLCFSVYWKIGITLIVIGVITAGIKIDQERSKK